MLVDAIGSTGRRTRSCELNGPLRRAEGGGKGDGFSSISESSSLIEAASSDSEMMSSGGESSCSSSRRIGVWAIGRTAATCGGGGGGLFRLTGAGEGRTDDL